MKRPIYRIAAWEQFELPGANSLKPLPAVQLPIDSLPHVKNPESGLLFGTYILLVLFAARRFPRGVLINREGSGLTIKSLATAIGLGQTWVKIALQKLLEAGLLEEVSPLTVADMIEELQPHRKPPRPKARKK